MSIDLPTLVTKLANTPPRCLNTAWPRALQSPSQILDNSNEYIATSWAIKAIPNHSQCMVIGTPVSIATNPPSQILFSPLALMYQGIVVEIFDPVNHGYNSEIDVIDAGIQKPTLDAQSLSQREPFECEQCAAKLFSVTAKVFYQYGTIDMLQKYIDLPTSDMFNAFNVYGVCATCQRMNIVAEADGL
jgi:hypothetical protein